MPKLGAYSKEIVLARPDGRSKEGRLLRQMREALIAHLGGEAALTPPRRVMVERAAMLQLRCAVLDRKIVDGTCTADEAKAQSALSSSLARILATLGLRPAKAPARTDNPWLDTLAKALDGFTGKIPASDVWRLVDKPRWDRTQSDNFRLGEAMRALGWTRTMARFGRQPASAYIRGTPAERRVPIYVLWDPLTGDTFATNSADLSNLPARYQVPNATSHV